MTEGKIMALDYGLRRIGIAMSDPLQITVFPFKTIESVTSKQNAETISKIAGDNGVCEIVIGLPVNVSGSEGKMAKIVRDFADELKVAANLPISLINEVFSSNEATEILVQKGIKFNHKDKGLKDRVSAALILQRYLEKNALYCGRL
jgi:putative Holliday junction resolvase